LTRRRSSRSSSSLFSKIGSISTLPLQVQPATVQLNQCVRLTGIGSLDDSLTTVHTDGPDWIINNIHILLEVIHHFKQN
jgi:hypothetical protein